MSKKKFDLIALAVALLLFSILLFFALVFLNPFAATSPSSTTYTAPVPVDRHYQVMPTRLPESWQRGSMWLDADELARLPMTGPAWDALLAAAQKDIEAPNLSDQGDDSDIYVLAKALVYARTGDSAYRQAVVTAITAAIGTEEGGRTLALGRNLVGYVIAADLVNLSDDEALDRRFSLWLQQLLTKNLHGRTLQSTHEDRPNNWGTHAGASRAAIAIYLNDPVELEQAARVFYGYLGNRDAYADFRYGELSWQFDPDAPVGVNPPGARKDGRLIDGALPEEMRRGGSFQWPPVQTTYPWEGLQGAIVQANLLHRAGYSAWEWEERALLRAARFLYNLGWPAEGDDQWQIWLINDAYGTQFPTALPARPGKNMGWTDWTHGAEGEGN